MSSAEDASQKTSVKIFQWIRITRQVLRSRRRRDVATNQNLIPSFSFSWSIGSKAREDCEVSSSGCIEDGSATTARPGRLLEEETQESLQTEPDKQVEAANNLIDCSIKVEFESPANFQLRSTLMLKRSSMAQVTANLEARPTSVTNPVPTADGGMGSVAVTGTAVGGIPAVSTLLTAAAKI
jgi:hypothetical protein